MRFYTKQHKFYCGIDLHARSMYLCILDQEGNTMLHKNYKASPEAFLRAIQPYQEDVAVECMYVWYWLGDLCTQEGIPFVLGHALYMKTIQRKRRTAPGRNSPGGLRLPHAHALYAGSPPTTKPHPEHQQPI